MTISVPFGGDHYLVDVLAGTGVAAVGIMTTRWITRMNESRPDANVPDASPLGTSLIGSGEIFAGRPLSAPDPVANPRP